MDISRIDFIASYCDSWCERCAYTARCSVFAVRTAIGMCGDAEQGFELAVGTPCPDGNEVPEQDRPWLDDLDKSPVTGAELAEFERRERERDRRLDAMPMMTRAREFSFGAHRWLRTPRQLSIPTDTILTEALEVAEHDAFLILVKLHRALRGRDQYREDNEGDDPTQNDWNGSAKVALLSVERSAAVWQTIACATGDETPAMLSRLLGDLQLDIKLTFPRARSFIRPGFDEPGR